MMLFHFFIKIAKQAARADKTVHSRVLHVAGIRSTGLSASPGIGRYVGELVRDELDLSLRNPFMDELPEYLTDIHPDEGEVVCLCRSITRGEILAALRSPLPPTTLDGLKRRTGAMLGDCQGNLCMARLIDLFQQLGRDPLTLDKNVAHSCPIVGHLPNAERPLSDDQLFDLPADTLVYGAGMMANTHWLKGSGIITEAYGTIQVDSSYQTNVQGIYAIGTVTVPSLDHADSIAMGKEVASLLAGGTQ